MIAGDASAMTQQREAFAPGQDRDDDTDRARRGMLLGLGALALLGPASCRSMTRPVDGTGVSGAARSRLGAIRAENGLPPLAPDAAAEKAALEQSGFMAAAGRMGHSVPGGRDFVSRMRSRGIAPPAAENLANGRMELDRVFDMWMASPAHRRNMLDPRYGRFGLAYAPGGDGRRYWTLVLMA